MADYWMKFYVEILDDPKMMQLPDRLFRRICELFLYAKSINSDGLIPALTDAAWRLHITADELRQDLEAIEQATQTDDTPGVIYLSDNGWFITNFAKRQGPSPINERVDRYRNKKRKEQYYGNENVTKDVTTRYTETEIDTDTEEKKKQKEPATSFTAPTFLAVSNFHDNDAREAEQLYQKITGQVTIPSDQRDRAMGDLSAIVPYYRGRNGDAVTEGQQIFNRWCNTRGKSGRNYSRTNPGWLAWWLEALAPIPLAPPVPEYDPGITREEAAALAERQRAQLAQEKLAKLAEQKRTR